jgi:hypothetical protein
LLHHSIFAPDRARIGEWLATLWQGPAPADLIIRQWLYLPGEPTRMVMVWDGGPESEAFVERVFGGFGTIETHVVTDATPGMAHAISRDLEAFGDWMAKRGATAEAVAAQVDLRRRGRDAPDQATAEAEGRAWTERNRR